MCSLPLTWCPVFPNGFVDVGGRPSRLASINTWAPLGPFVLGVSESFAKTGGTMLGVAGILISLRDLWLLG